jgi:hypothetical protein
MCYVDPGYRAQRRVPPINRLAATQWEGHMSATIYVLFVSLAGLLLAGLVSRVKEHRRLLLTRVIVLSAMSGWMLYLLSTGSQSGIFAVLLTAFFVSGAVKCAMDLDALRSDVPIDQS